MVLLMLQILLAIVSLCMIVPSNKFNEGIDVSDLKKPLSIFIISFILQTISFVLLKNSVNTDLKLHSVDVQKLKEMSSCFDEQSRVPEAELNQYQMVLAKSGSSYGVVLTIEIGLALAYLGAILLFVFRYKVLRR